MQRIYLAGPITGLTYDGADDWRQHVTKQLEGAHVLSPLRGKDYLREAGTLEDQYFDLHPLSTSKGITNRDRNAVRSADLVFAYLLGAERVSIGTMIEFVWADAFRVPVVAVMESNNVHHHAMATEFAGWITDDLEEAIRIAKTVVAL